MYNVSQSEREREREVQEIDKRWQGNTGAGFDFASLSILPNVTDREAGSSQQLTQEPRTHIICELSQIFSLENNLTTPR